MPGQLPPAWRCAALAVGLVWAPFVAAAPPAGPAVTQEDGPRQLDEARALIRTGNPAAALPLLREALTRHPDDARLQADYLLCLIWTGADADAIAYYEARTASLAAFPDVPCNVAQAYSALGKYPAALALYQTAWAADPLDGEALKGVVRSALHAGDVRTAEQALAKARTDGTLGPETLTPLQAELLTALGASQETFRATPGQGSTPAGDLATRRNDAAIQRLRWGEAGPAAAELKALLAADPGNARVQGDYIVALRQQNRMPEVLDAFARFQASGHPVPSWVHLAVADALRTLRRPEESRAAYEQALRDDPDNLDALFGLEATDVDLRRWAEVQATLDRIDRVLAGQERALAQSPSVMAKQRYQADRDRALVERGWFLLHQDQLAAGQEYFAGYLAQAGGNSAVRAGLAQAYLWRERPRLARDEFQVIRETDSDNRAALVGLGWTLRALNDGAGARRLAETLNDQAPWDPDVRDLRETLAVDDSWQMDAAAAFVKEFPGASEYLIGLHLFRPLIPAFGLFTDLVRQEAWEQTGGTTTRSVVDRAGVGFRWSIVPPLVWTQNVSFDFVTGSQVGAATQLRWRPTDPVQITVDYNSFSLSVPLQARAAGVTAQAAGFALQLDPDESESAGLTVGSYWFSDGNVHPVGSVFYRQAVFTSPALRITVGAEAGLESYSQQEPSYYSPQYAWTGLATAAFRWRLAARYDTTWDLTLRLRAGVGSDAGHPVVPVGGVTLDMAYRLSKWFAVSGTVSCDRRVYSGVDTEVLGVTFGLEWAF
jgi:tetratricopeptide (TPR) repeat protein